MTWLAKGYGTIYQGGDIKGNVRIDHICPKCRFHTSQVRVDKGWRCKECRTTIKEDANV